MSEEKCFLHTFILSHCLIPVRANKIGTGIICDLLLFALLWNLNEAQLFQLYRYLILLKVALRSKIEQVRISW
jgi:hypothetical protein